LARTREEIEAIGRPCRGYAADVAVHERAREVGDDVIRRIIVDGLQ
jgi:hypothetical protein